jgi:hypothetical protein
MEQERAKQIQILTELSEEISKKNFFKYFCCPNIFLLMERTGFLLSLISAYDTYF